VNATGFVIAVCSASVMPVLECRVRARLVHVPVTSAEISERAHARAHARSTSRAWHRANAELAASPVALALEVWMVIENHVHLRHPSQPHYAARSRIAKLQLCLPNATRVGVLASTSKLTRPQGEALRVVAPLRQRTLARASSTDSSNTYVSGFFFSEPRARAPRAQPLCGT
jgi:hypothetical protein